MRTEQHMQDHRRGVRQNKGDPPPEHRQLQGSPGKWQQSKFMNSVSRSASHAEQAVAAEEPAVWLAWVTILQSLSVPRVMAPWGLGNHGSPH